jgi:hypothetical protein
MQNYVVGMLAGTMVGIFNVQATTNALFRAGRRQENFGSPVENPA